MSKKMMGLLFLGVLISSPSAGQDKSKYYTIQHADEFSMDWVGFYETCDERTAKARKELPHHLDLPYGDDPKQKLDLYLPKEKPEGAPTFLFLHGGGMREGDRAHYGYIATPFAANGIITAVASYRLTGQGFHFPDQPEDVAAAVRWIHQNIQKYGGDPDLVYVGGHSAGAILSAYVGVRGTWREKMGLPKGLIKGVAPVSGPYDLRAVRRSGEIDGYVPDPELRAEASPILNVDNPVPRTVVAFGSLEPFEATSRELVDNMKARGVKAELVVLEDENHDQTALSLGDQDSVLFLAVLKMIQAR